MGLFSTLGKSLMKFTTDTAAGIQYVGKEEKEDKGDIFILHFKGLLKKAYTADEELEIITAVATVGIFAAKSDGIFTKSEGLELLDFMDATMDTDEISREEILDLILTISDAPIKMEDLGNLAINLSQKYGKSSIEVLRSFIEYIIYSDGELHPKELNFLKNWDKTIEIMSSHTRY